MMLAAAVLAFGLVAGCDRAETDGASANSMGPKTTPGSPGKQVFDQWCASCHADSARAPGTVALAAKYGKDMPAALERRDNLTPEVVQMFVRNGVSIMPRFRKTEISDTDLAELSRYLSGSPAQRR
jgi:mono/diheme cytochrome c family protein